MPTVAVIGASPDRTKFGNKSLRAHIRAGYTVYPVHPTAAEVEGLPAYRSLAALPVPRVDRVTLYLPPAVLLPLLDEIAAFPAGEVWFNPGTDTPAVLSRAREFGMPVVVGCSIVDVGVSPYALD